MIEPRAIGTRSIPRDMSRKPEVNRLVPDTRAP